ncbi:MAG: DUF2282 domain-containing protein [Rhodospirillales bacterium]|nr:DUF2282 domain-containing protein [Alphaproteobacteria bacterium]MCB9976412.1 DUF2282 domain-containing protein [Rhodospirillales bacterium]
MKNKKTLSPFLTGAVAAAAMGLTQGAFAMGMSGDKEKCYGVVKAGKNDCGSADKAHSCAGHAGVDRSGQEWIGLPKGVCERLAGGSLEPVAPALEETPVEDAPAEVMPPEEDHEE